MFAARVRTLLCATAFAVPFAVGISSVASQAPPPTPVASETPRLSRDISVKAGDMWTTTDVVLEPGERAVFTGKGTGRCPGQNADFGPIGLPRGFRDLLRVLPLQAGRGALIGRVGDADVGLPFVIGASADIVAIAGGPLAVGIN